jgi:hypothetical protein
MPSKVKRKQIDLNLSQGTTYGIFNSPQLDNTDIMEEAFDKVVAILDQLVPPSAPDLSDISIVDSGTAGKLSFGSGATEVGYTNVPTLDINGTITVGSVMKGIFSGTTMNGVIADSTTVGPGSPTAAYPADAFGYANTGILNLVLNGVTAHTVDLSVFVSGNTLTSGTGFNLSAAQASKFSNGAEFTGFQWRTGTWTVSLAAQTNGYNVVYIEHIKPTGTDVTNSYTWILDSETILTSYSGETLNGLSMTGTKFISGVKYHTAGTAQYSITASNAFRNTYSSSLSAVSHPGVSNCSVASVALPSIADNLDNYDIINKTVTVTNSSRLLGVGLTVNTRIDRTVQTDSNSSGVSAFQLLLDNVAASSTGLVEQFNDEQRRMNSGVNSDLTNTSYTNAASGSPYDWNSIEDLISGITSHNTGLLVYNSRLYYPKATDVVNSGNFSTIANGPTGNPDYSAASGPRTYYRFFSVSAPKQNFSFNVQATTTTFVAKSTPLSGNNLWFEMLAPNTTSNGVITEFKDCVTSYLTDNGIGCYSSAYGPTIPTDWGISLGSKNTSTSNNTIVIRITAPDTWTGYIDSITLVE